MPYIPNRKRESALAEFDPIISIADRSDRCMAQSVNQLGNTTATECGTSPGDTGGCTVVSSTDASYGTGFAAAGGGVYVAEFATDGIRVWFYSVRHHSSRGTCM